MPTPRTIPDEVAGACAPAIVIVPMPSAAVAASAATPAPTARDREDFSVFNCVPSLSEMDRAGAFQSRSAQL